MTAKTRRKAAPTPAWFTIWNELSTPVKHGISLSVLGVIAVSFMAPDIFSSRQLVGGDIVQWKAMAESVFEWKALSGKLPLWATGPFMGMPANEIAYSRGVPQIDDLARLLRSLFWPTSHLLILFGGAYGLVWYLTRDHWAGVFSAVAFGLTTYLPLLLIAGHHSKYVALALTPWLLWSFAYAGREPSLKSALLFAIATAACLRAGHVQITYYAAFTIGIWWLVGAVMSVRNGQAKELAKMTGWLGAGGLLGILMAAHPYLAKAEYKAYTIRGAASGGAEGGMGWDYAMAWSQGIGELLTLFIADAFGGSRGTYWGDKVFTAGPHYLGGVVILLALYAVFLGRRRQGWGLAAAAVLMLAFSVGQNFESLNRLMFNHFPLFDAFRVPETWLSMVALVVAVLAGLGLMDIVRRLPDTGEDRVASKKVDRLAIGMVVVAGAMMLFGGTFLDFERPGELEQLARQVSASRPDLSLEDPQTIQLLREALADIRDERRDLFATDARRTFLFLLAAAALLMLARRRRIPGWVAQAGLVVLISLDLGGVGRRYFNGDVLQPARRAESPVPEYGFDTYLRDLREAAGGPGTFRVLSLEGDPTVTARPAYYHESLGGYHGAKLRRYQDFLDNILFGPSGGQPSPAALAMTNTRYVVARGTVPGGRAVFSDQGTGFSVFEIPYALDRGYFVDSLAVVASSEAQWAALAGPGFNPARVAVVSDALGLQTAPDSAFQSVVMTSFEPDAIEWQVSTAVPRLFVAAEVYYPAGWTATIDDAPAEIVPVNYLLRGVSVPAGTHTLRMTFLPRTHRLGLWIAWVTTVLVYGGLAWILIGMWRDRATGS